MQIKHHEVDTLLAMPLLGEQGALHLISRTCMVVADGQFDALVQKIASLYMATSSIWFFFYQSWICKDILLCSHFSIESRYIYMISLSGVTRW